MMTLRIVQANRRDHAALEAIQLRASVANPGDRESVLANPSAVTLPVEQIDAGCVFAALVGDELVGFAAMFRRPDGSMELDGLFVDPPKWRNGIGAALVRHCASMCGSIGAGMLHVIGNPHAMDFYEACGFVRAGSVHTQFGQAERLELTL